MLSSSLSSSLAIARRAAGAAAALSRCASPATPIVRLASRNELPSNFLGFRYMTTIQELATADDAWKKSCFAGMGNDFTINDNSSVYDAVQKLAGFNIGCLVTVDDEGNMTGVVSERDYVCKIALLGRTSKETPVKQISTKLPNLVTAQMNDSIEDCMARMLTRDIRHLPLVGEDGTLIGLISIKDLVKTLVQEKEKTIKVLSDFALGKGGHFSND